MTRLLQVALSLTPILLAPISLFSQQWVSLSSQRPCPVKTELLSSTEDVITVELQVPGYYVLDVNTPKGEANIISISKAVNTLNAGEPNLPMIAIPAIIGDDASATWLENGEGMAASFSQRIKNNII